MLEELKYKLAKRKARKLILLFNSKIRISPKFVTKVFENQVSRETTIKNYSFERFIPKINFLETISVSKAINVQEFIAERVLTNFKRFGIDINQRIPYRYKKRIKII